MPFSSFGQLSSLDYLSAPALQNFAGIQIFAASQVQTSFEFDAGGNRARQIKQRIAAGGASRQLEETLYLGAYEREYHRTRPVGSGTFVTDRTVHRHSLGGFAVYTRTDSPAAGSVTKLTTILKDHLGSTDVLYTGTWNGSAFASPATERQSFDPWGERRAPDTLVSYRTTDTDAFRTSAQDYDRGYTGHEQLDDSGLIHMNGRLYDPELGRMLSPDPVVQVPEYSQNFNRYSYVMNNPLNLTDPTGFSWLGNAFSSIGGWLKENWRTVVVIVVMAVITICSFGTLTGAAAVAGATLLGATATAAVTASVGAWAVAAIGGAFLGGIAGGLSAALAGGDLGDVLRGAVIGGVSGALAAGLTASGVGGVPQVAGQGVVGGATNAAMGGKFQDGFLSAAAGAAAGMVPYANTGAAGLIKSSVVGGTASSLGGGKFANGASTAAFQYLVTTGLEPSRTVKVYVSGEGGWGGEGGAYLTGSEGYISQSWQNTLARFAKWVLGSGPEAYGPNTLESNEMKNSPIGENLVQVAAAKNTGQSPSSFQDLRREPLKFGFFELLGSGSNATAQFVGSGVGKGIINSYQPVGGNTGAYDLNMTFTIENTTSISSFLYHITPNSFNITRSGMPFSNYNQSYSWDETIRVNGKP